MIEPTKASPTPEILLLTYTNYWQFRIWLSISTAINHHTCFWVFHFSFNPFDANVSFFYTLKPSENCKVFCYFQWVEKGWIGNGWVNSWIISKCMFVFKIVCCKKCSNFKVWGDTYWPIWCHWSLSIPPKNIKKTDFLMFLGDIKRDHCHEVR